MLMPNLPFANLVLFLFHVPMLTPLLMNELAPKLDKNSYFGNDEKNSRISMSDLIAYMKLCSMWHQAVLVNIVGKQ